MKTIQGKNKINQKTILFMVIVFFIIQVPAALAHKIYIFTWVENDMVHTQSYYSAKKKVRQGSIKIHDLADNLILTGLTDDNGEFSFKMPVDISSLKIILNAGLGHGAETTMDLKGHGVSSDSAIPHKHEDQILNGPTDSFQNQTIDPDQLKIIIEQAMDSRLKPVIRELAELRREKEPGFRDIIGGIGYIFGIFGIIFYFKSREKFWNGYPVRYYGHAR